MELVFNNLWLAWIVVSIVCLIVELNSGDLYFICFAIVIFSFTNFFSTIITYIWIFWS